MSFNVDTWRAAHPPWSFTVEGRTFVARPVSAIAVADLVDGIDGVPAREQARRLRKLFRLAFPWRATYLAARRLDPVRQLFALEPGVYQGTLADFFVHLGLGKSAPSPATSGTP